MDRGNTGLATLGDVVVTVRPLEASELRELGSQLAGRVKAAAGHGLLIGFAGLLVAASDGGGWQPWLGFPAVLSIYAIRKATRALVDITWLVRDRRRRLVVVLSSPRGVREKAVPSGRSLERRQ